ncbi:uncharacterized protein LOC118734426 [Rhagoletis pomonella]|uniref:uncharacterized protein LOC118734426 n=1 Tax=Rhagoletis pomonella TaxID=28610 RepID=UPI00178395EE|nr:uncharacterized protein LOC118734426 [Rhagoletis pomonella]
MVTILDLPDECLTNICKRLDDDFLRYCWVNVCKRFQYIYYGYFHNWTEVNDYLAQNFGHQIGTNDFPMKIVKRINLSKLKCSKKFLNKLRLAHPEVEEAKLFSFTDEYMAELLPLPNLKVLICIGTYDLRGRSLIDLCGLTELHIHTNKSIDAENVLQATYYNPLRVLVIPNDPGVFAERYAFEMVDNLKYLEKLVVEYNHCKSWQLIGTLPRLKKLEIWDFVTHGCAFCWTNPDSYQTCAPNHDKIFFNELCKKDQLEELIFCDGCLTEFHLTGISQLKSLRILKFSRAAFIDEVSLDVFADLVNFEELHIDNGKRILAYQSLEFFRNCQKLKRVNFWYAGGINGNFISKANDILGKRKPPPREPVTFGFQFLNANYLRATIEGLYISTPVFYIRITHLQRKFVAAEESYLETEEEAVSQSPLQGELLKRKFSIMNIVPVETEIKMEFVGQVEKRQDPEGRSEGEE